MSATANIAVDAITVGERLRDISPASVKLLMQSITDIGLRTPITVRTAGKETILVSGAHRLEAVKMLGWTKIEAFVIDEWNELEARRWEIAENLHRADLTALQRDEQIAEWVRITEKLISAHVVEKSKTESNPRGAGRPAGGVSGSAEEIGVNRETARRAIKVDGLTKEAKKAARELGLDNNQRALLAASRLDDDEQADFLRNWKAETARRPKLPPAVTKDDPPDMYVVSRQLAAKYSVIELTLLIDHLGDLIKEREAA